MLHEPRNPSQSIRYIAGDPTHTISNHFGWLLRSTAASTPGLIENTCNNWPFKKSRRIMINASSFCTLELAVHRNCENNAVDFSLFNSVFRTYCNISEYYRGRYPGSTHEVHELFSLVHTCNLLQYCNVYHNFDHFRNIPLVQFINSVSDI